ncbi:MAG: CapA family protein [Firmicutes bacterium]|nr:CapA family protein [Candidatus Colimorpha enterica]
MSKNTASVLFTGDVCFKYQHGADEAVSREILSEMIPIFNSSDILVMNLETPLADEGVGTPIRKCGPNIIGRPRNVGFLKAAGCDAVSLANNHTGDFGDEALFATTALLDENGIGHFGAGENIDAAYTAWRTEKNGIRLSVIGVCEHEFGLADRTHAGTAALDLDRLAGKIAEEKAVSDFVVVMSHGGSEHCPVPTPKTKERYHLMLRLGADAVIGAHPHCPQGIEIIDGKPIVYSTGNYIFRYDSEDLPETWFYGYVAKLTLTRGEKPKVEAIPYRFEADGSKVIPLSGDVLERMNGYLDELSAIAADDGLLAKYYDGWCMARGFNASEVSAPDGIREKSGAPLEISKYVNYRNCESHTELIARTAVLLFEGKCAEAMEWKDKVLSYQKIGNFLLV